MIQQIFTKSLQCEFRIAEKQTVVLVLPPRRRWDFCFPQIHQLWRKPLREEFICPKWRRSAWELLAKMWNRLRLFDGRAASALWTRWPFCFWQCNLCECLGDLQPMWLDFLFGQVQVCKWDALKAHWHECCGMKCLWNWRIGKIGKIDIRHPTEVGLTRREYFFCSSFYFSKMVLKVMPSWKVAALRHRAIWAWQMLRWCSSWRHLESSGEESSDIHEVHRMGFEVSDMAATSVTGTSKSWANCGFSVSRQLAGEHFKLTSKFCNPHKASM